MEKLNFIGIGSATNVKLGGNCSYLKDGDNLLVIDMCEGITEKLEDYDVFKDVKNIYIVITHTHFDHIAGLGVFIWYCDYVLKIKPQVIYSNLRYLWTLKKLLKLTGVSKKHVRFIKDTSFKINDLTLKLQKTTHAPKLQCFGIMFNDKLGKYYYSGDTNDIDYIKKLCKDFNVKIIYTDVTSDMSNTHIRYDDIINMDKDKLTLMHFNTIELYNKAKEDGFEVACRKTK